MSGLLGTGRAIDRISLSMLDGAAQNEQRLDTAKKQEQAAQSQSRASLAGTGAAAGWMIGAKAGSVGGPAGAAIGAGIGLLAGELL